VLTGSNSNPEAKIIVVVCREGNRQVGIAVSHVLDVAPGRGLFEAGTSYRTSGVTLLQNRVTGVVDLGAVSQLPIRGAAPDVCGKFEEVGR
jgi:two-component system chemotaxis sensor kinase CheA